VARGFVFRVTIAVGQRLKSALVLFAVGTDRPGGNLDSRPLLAILFSMETNQKIKEPLLLANRVVNETRCYREEGESALVYIAWRYSNAANARVNEERNVAMFQAVGLGNQRFLVKSLEQAAATELAAHDAFVKEFKSYLARRAARKLMQGTAHFTHHALFHPCHSR
jgi:hypothetical protein